MLFVGVCGVQSFAMLFIEFILHQCFFVDLDHDFFNVLSPLLCTCSLLLLLTKWHLFQLLSKIKYVLHYSMGWMKFMASDKKLFIHFPESSVELSSWIFDEH